MRHSFLCLERVPGHCSQGLRRTGRVQSVSAPTGALKSPISLGQWKNAPGGALNNLKVYLIRKGAGFPFHFLAVWEFFKEEHSKGCRQHHYFIPSPTTLQEAKEKLPLNQLYRTENG